MRCRHAEKLIFDYIDGIISESDRLALELHLRECRTCEAASAALAKSLGLLHRMPKAEPSENFNWKVRLRLSRERHAWAERAESEGVWLRGWQSRFALGALCAFAVALVGGFVFLKFAGAPGVVSTGFVAQPGPASVVPDRGAGVSAESRSNGIAQRIDPFGLGDDRSFGARPVSTGFPSPLGLDMSGAGALFENDSLAYRPITARKDYQRIRQLEQQVEILRKELENCNLECGK